MSDNTRIRIEWANTGLPRVASWNPIRARNRNTGKAGWNCAAVSDGCRNCYAEGINKRLGTGLPYKRGHDKDIEIILDEKTLLQPLKWREPRGIFVGSMTDAFAAFVTDAMLDRMFAVAALCPQHRFLWLTKRPERMCVYMRNDEKELYSRLIRIGEAARSISVSAKVPSTEWPWPLPNCWAGTSIEDQPTADERIPHLLTTPAAVRFVSYEPVLAPVSFRAWMTEPTDNHLWRRELIDWIIAGSESGPRARPCNLSWVRSVRNQCIASDTKFFWKQHVENGRKISLPELDGRSWAEMPEPRS